MITGRINQIASTVELSFRRDGRVRGFLRQGPSPSQVPVAGEEFTLHREPDKRLVTVAARTGVV